MFSTVCQYDLIVMGASSGGLDTYSKIFAALPKDFKIPIMLIQHVSPLSESVLPEILNKITALKVKEAEMGDIIMPGHIYTAPPGYHVLIDTDNTVSLSVDDPIHYARPSIDVTFESAAAIYGDRLVGVILTGANDDGAHGLLKIKQCNGLTLIQDPCTAIAKVMPEAAKKLTKTTKCYSIEDLITKILNLEENA